MTQIIKQVDKLKNEVVLDERSLYVFENILSNYRIQRRIYGVLYQQIAESFKRSRVIKLCDEIQALNLYLAGNGGGIQAIEKY